MGRLLRVGLLCASAEDTCGLYRGFGPFNYMDMAGELRSSRVRRAGWLPMSKLDVLFLQRPQGALHVEAMYRAKECGKKVVVDFDDDFTSIPVWNPAWLKIASNEAGYFDNYEKLLVGADQVWCSTPMLERRMREFLDKRGVLYSASKFRVIANGWDFRNWGMAQEYNKQPQMLWRGTATHDRDLWEATQEIIDCIKFAGALGHNPKVARGSRGEDNLTHGITLIGNPFWMSLEMFSDSGIDVEVHDRVSFNKMLSLMRSTGAEIGLIPLSKHVFNECKSNIAALEMVSCGILPVCSQRAEFEHVPGIICNDVYGIGLSQAFDMGHAGRAVAWKQAAQWMREFASLEGINKLRKQALVDLMDIA